MEREGLEDLGELQSYFVRRVADIVQSHGKQLISWDEIVEGGLADGAIVMSWRGTEGGVQATEMGHRVIMSPRPDYYLDLYQGHPGIEPATYGMARLGALHRSPRWHGIRLWGFVPLNARPTLDTRHTAR